MHTDLDLEIERASNQSIAELIKEEGEGAFRLWERLVLRNLPEDLRMIVSTGGGTPVYQNNMEYMLQQGLVVYLKTSSDVILQRLLDNEALMQRPLLSDFAGDPRGLLIHLQQLQLKRSVYYETAHITVDRTSSVSDAAAEIIRQLQEFT